MTDKIKNLFMVLLSLFLLTNCSNRENEFLEDPTWLQKPLYEVLQKQGKFNSYLACLDKTLYAPQIKEGGYFTLMAPNDEAFAAYLSKHNYKTIDDIPADELNKIVAYSVLQSYWLSENLGDLFTGTVDNRYSVGDGLKKQTYYYETIYKDSTLNNSWVIDQNTSSTSFSSSTYNYKFYPVFMQNYFAKGNLAASDYNVFFPEVEYVGGQTVSSGEIGNVCNGKIVTPNMKARNGVAHEVSGVNVPMENMDKVLQQESYKTYKSLLDFKNLSGAFVYKNYIEDVTLTEKYKLLKPDLNIDKVYVKSYNTTGTEGLSFSPALDAIYNDDGNITTPSDGYTLFVPSNQVLTDYINKKLLKYYSSLTEIPVGAITALINTHMANTMIWPSQLKASQVSTGEYVNGVGASGKTFDDFGVVDKKLTSNGFVYTIDHVIKSKLLETVYAEIYLNPAQSYLNALYNKYYSTSIKEDLMKSVITGYPNIRHTVLMLPDALLKADGFKYDSESSTFTHNVLSSPTTVDNRIKHLAQNHLFEGWVVDGGINSEVTFQDGVSDYGGWGFRNTNNGDVVRYKNNKLQASGNIEDNSYVAVTKGETFDNGTVYTIDKMLQYSKRETGTTTAEIWNENTIWYYLNQTSLENTNVSKFVDYVHYSIKSSTTDDLKGISETNFYTIVMPNNNAITKAVANGDLPSLDSLKAKYNDTDGTYKLDQSRVDLAANFVKSHFLEGTAYPDDRLPYIYPYNANAPTQNLVSTALRVNNEALRLVNQRTYITVSKDASGNLTFTPNNFYNTSGTMTVSGAYGKNTPAAKIVLGAATKGNNGYRSNRIAGKSIHHEYTSYFKFAIQR